MIGSTILLVAALAAEPSREAELPPTPATLAQVELWLDMEELGKADALTRLATKERPDDVSWWWARARLLSAAGMDGWLQHELAREGRGLAARSAWQALQAWGGKDVTVESGTAAMVRDLLAAGREPAGRALAGRLTGRELARAALWLGASAGDVDGVLAATAAVDLAAEPELVEALWWLPDDKRVLRARERLLTAVDAAALTAPPELRVRLALLLLRVKEAERLGAVAGGLAAADLQALFDALHQGPAGFDAWEAPPRPRWGEAMIGAVAQIMARREDPSPPWSRPSERTGLVTTIVGLLEKQGRQDQGRALVQESLGPCWSDEAAVRFMAGDRGGARARMKEDLSACVGTIDFVPDSDPAGVDPQAGGWAAGWGHYAEAARVGDYPEEAAIAAGVAAWLEPSEPRREQAARLAREARMMVDPQLGLPDAEWLAQAVEEAAWLRPIESVQADRAARLRARTAAWLSPTPERLTARITPADACVPTLRSRCQLEWAVARAAWVEAGREVPADLPEATDAGAKRQATMWSARLAQARFTAAATAGSAGVRQLTGLEQVAATLREGRPAPPWSVGGQRGEELGGRMVLLSFWASWCKPCLEELPMLDQLSGGWKADGLDVVVLGVNLDADEGAWRRALGRLDPTHLRLIRDPAAAEALGVHELPTLVLIDAGGVVRAIRVGWDPEHAGKVDEIVRSWGAVGAR